MLEAYDCFTATSSFSHGFLTPLHHTSPTLYVFPCCQHCGAYTDPVLARYRIWSIWSLFLSFVLASLNEGLVRFPGFYCSIFLPIPCSLILHPNPTATIPFPTFSVGLLSVVTGSSSTCVSPSTSVLSILLPLVFSVLKTILMRRLPQILSRRPWIPARPQGSAARANGSCCEGHA